ncbi:hypothetical protein J4217_00160 [Candidatus Pacearchaeota archaeon]|nr:hypothetical protein [Candidatus Pacearchaeota archaeon]
MAKKKEETKDKTERCATGIQGFDVLCEGGLIADSANLVVGNAGAGKTTFLLQFLHNGAVKYNEKGLYVSFEPEVAELYKAGRKQGMDFEKLEEEGKCFFLKLADRMNLGEIEKTLTNFVVKNDIKRICFDPINVFAIRLKKDYGIRVQIYNLISLLKKLAVCVVIAGEAEEEKATGEAELEEDVIFTKYLVDGVIELFSSGLGGEGDRAVRISKMRMTNHVRGPVGMKIDNSGIKVLGKAKFL